jgi:hypothetical protein
MVGALFCMCDHEDRGLGGARMGFAEDVETGGGFDGVSEILCCVVLYYIGLCCVLGWTCR